MRVEWVRLAYDKWDSAERDFLTGDASNYNGLVKGDLEKLKQVIGWTSENGMSIVIAPLSLPGSRYIQNNDFKHDMCLWESYDYWNQAIRFWKDLAYELKDLKNDEWDGYDYELGTQGLGWKYWQAKEKGEDPPLPRKANQLFMIIKRQFKN